MTCQIRRTTNSSLRMTMLHLRMRRSKRKLLFKIQRQQLLAREMHLKKLKRAHRPKKW